ncbi:MAG: ABC transporter ATP-binding protein [bacterium]
MSARPKDPVRKGLRLDRAVRLVWASAPGLAVANAALVAVQGLLPLAGLYAIKQVVDLLQAGIAAGSGPAGFQRVLVWVGVAAAAALLTAIAHSLAELVGQAQSLVLSDKVTDIVHGQSVAMDLGYYEDPRYHDTLHRAQGDAMHRPVNIVNRLVQVGRGAVSLAGIAGLLFALSPLVALVLVVVALPGAVVRMVHARRLYRFEREQTEKERRAWYYHWLLTNSFPAKELRLFDIGALFRQRYRELRRQLRRARLVLARRRSAAGLLAQAAVTVATFGTLVYIAWQTWRGTITIGSLVMYYSAFQLAANSLSAILAGLAGLYEDNLFLANFYEFLDLQPRVTAPAKPLPVPARFARGIAFEGVSFAYPGSSRPALDAVSLAIAPGQVVALVGANGSGKTTLVKLLCRLYDPGTGQITVDGIDIRRLEPARWRREVSVILQDFVQYQLPAWENIWLGDAAAEPDRARIVAAAKRAGADAAISRLPQGYDTPLGRWFESGLELSIGEWQKVALARAFMRRSQLVVLDEPTSALDPLAEAELFEQFRGVLDGRSAVLVSHRFSTVQLADYIYVLDKGRIREQGTHHELLELGELYARMYLAQASHYRET